MAELGALRAGFREYAGTQPGVPALRWHEETVSYRQLREMVERERQRIAALDLRPGEPVGVLAAKSPAAIALVLACVFARRPFLLPSPELGEQTLTELFARAGCRRVLTPAGTAEWSGGAGPVSGAPVPDGVSFMLTTSGSTGRPKIVPLAQQGVDRFVGWAAGAFGIGAGTGVLNLAPLNFDLCLLDVWTTLSRGGTVVLADPGRAPDGRYLVDLLSRHPVEVVQSVPMFLSQLAAVAAKRGVTFERVRHLIVTGDVLAERTLAALPALFPAATLHNVYGCTETNDSFVHRIDPAAGPGPLPIGRPLPGVRTLLLDPDGAVLTGPGDGELLVSTPFQTAGYLAAPNLAGKFTGHPQGLDDRRYFRTGDLVRRGPDGALLLTGRADFQVKVRGVAVNTAEVERVLLEHPGVAEAAVLAAPDPEAGKRLLATVRRTPGSDLTGLALREHCARHLPRAAIPAVLRTVDDPLPRTTTGKVDRKAANERQELPRAERRVS